MVASRSSGQEPSADGWQPIVRVVVGGGGQCGRVQTTAWALHTLDSGRVFMRPLKTCMNTSHFLIF